MTATTKNRATIVSSRYEKKRLQTLARYVTGNNVLDIGYAQLPNAYLSQKGRRLTGIDLSSPQKPNDYDNHLTGHIFNLRELDGGERYDCIVAGEFIEHMERPYDLLRYLSDSLSPNGTLIISTPNPLSFPVIFFERSMSRKRFYTADHTYYFNPRWMRRIIDRTGFKLTQMKGVGLWPIGIACPVNLSYQVVYVAQRP